MAFVSLIFTALRLKSLQKTLVEEKLEALKVDRKEQDKVKFRFRHIGVDIRVAVKNFFKRIFKCPEESRVHQTCYKLQHEGSCENYTLKSVFGFLGGVLLTYLLYFFFIFQLNVKLTSATVICSLLGCILTVGLAFSSNVRCIVLLTLPQFFSKRGRQALLAYAFVLALTGPAQNTLNNMGILSESLACGQEQLKQAVKQIIDVIKKPFVAIKEAIKKVVKTVKEVIKKIKEILLKIKRIIMALVRVIKSVFEFLGKIINICNKELGTPFERCSRVFENAIADCNAKLGPLFSWLCSLAYIVKAVCYIVKIFDYVCMLVDFISNSVVGVVIRKVKTFVRHIKTMFYVRIKFSHSFKYETKASKSLTEIAKEIVAEIKYRSKGIVAFFNLMTSAVMLFFLYMVFQTAYYRIRYLTSERFDNIYITKNFRDIDRRRSKIGRETVLPLTKKESKTYVPISSGALASSERKKLSKSAVSLATASVKLATHMVADYCLYWILTMITYHGRYQSKIQAPNLPVAHISGEGFIAKLLRVIVNAFQPAGIQLEIDTVPCLPIPIPPDFDRYIQIGITLMLCWILTLLEPYGLRFRNYIMGYYHPLRAKQRTIWLYNHILRSRATFLIFARRQLRRKFGKKGTDYISCKELLRSKLSCGILRICLGSDLQKTCLLCGDVYREGDDNKFFKCQTPDCPGFFCLECFKDLKNICPVCLSPIEYGDLDDADEEKDSSGDESPSKKPKKKKRKCPCFPCGRDDSDDREQLIDKREDKEYPEDKEGTEDETDTSTDYSTTYQYDDTEQKPYPKDSVLKDVEMQPVPDYASMEHFRNERNVEVGIENIIHMSKDAGTIVEIDIKEICEEQCSESSPLIDSASQYSNQSEKETRHVEFIGVPNRCTDTRGKVKHKLKYFPSPSVCICSDLDLAEQFEETSFVTLPKSTMSTSTRSDCKFCKAPRAHVISALNIGYETEEELRNIVPKLDLSFLDGGINQFDSPKFTDRFTNVRYEEMCETPSSSRRSLESSSILSSLQHSSSDRETNPFIRRRNTDARRMAYNTAYSRDNMDSSSSIDSYEMNKTRNRKIKQYYETTNRLCMDERCQYIKKKTPFKDMFKKLLPKRKKNKQTLPLYLRDIDDTVEVRSYNYSAENWDILDAETDSPTYPFGSRQSSTASEEQLLLGSRRIRGGECTHLINCKLIGRTCTQRIPQANYINRQLLYKDFSKLALPPKPKSANVIDILSRYFLSIEDLTPTRDPGFSMTTPESFRNTQPGQNIEPNLKSGESDFIISRSSAAVLNLPEEATPASSESGLSSTVCRELFGDTCPKGITKGASENTNPFMNDQETEQINISIENNLNDTSGSNLVENSFTSEEKTLSDPITAQQNSLTQIIKEPSVKSNHSIPLSVKSVNQKRISSQFERTASEAPLEKVSVSSIQKKASSNLEQAILEEPVILSNKRSREGKDELLYKDNKTEISLVRSLNGDKKQSKLTLPQSNTVLRKPSLKLQITLHNTLIEEEANSDIINMKSPQSKDKFVETTETFPLKPDWLLSNDSAAGKIVIANDKMQQTSDNDFCRSSANIIKTNSKNISRPCLCPLTSGDSFKVVRQSREYSDIFRPDASTPKYTTSENYYSYEIPEKDPNTQRHCKCPACRAKQMNRYKKSSEEESLSGDWQEQHQHYRANNPPCNCCRCLNSLPPIETTYRRDTFRTPSPPPFYYPPEQAYNEPRYIQQVYPEVALPTRLSQDTEASKKPYNVHIEHYHTECQYCCKPRMPSPQRYPKMNRDRQYIPRSRFRKPYGIPRNYDPRSYTSTEETEYSDYDPNDENNLTDLPYQDNEDYLELVQELQDTLHTRNRNRVRKTMQEFEKRSKQNKPLEKPIIDYDQASESEEPIIKKIEELKTCKKMCCAGDKCTCQSKRDAPKTGSLGKEKANVQDLREDVERPSHWTMDPGSGEWYKDHKDSKSRGSKSSRNSSDVRECFCKCRQARRM
ncbi:uncharacterized protein LOC115888990 isoform X2 [Sitophilus oryzae]|uniref:Uncharacterized protein LOC115888990 isoform X2 n=1 Tax=Sitophilus oryzae TaxID=7048 RepID=A0A6J2YNB3_SITOR|nr:uncharacterized protein LOC115888990 isoform X2 [Sitophilus oryzae]